MEAALSVVVCVLDWISTEFMNETVIPLQYFEPTIQLNRDAICYLALRSNHC